MNYNITKVILKIKYDENTDDHSILKIYFDKSSKVFKITKHLGDGTYGKVYLIEDINKEQYALKLSTIYNDQTLLDEVNNMYNLFKNNNVIHSCYPLCYGNFINSIEIGIVYPYFGIYNLETIKDLDYNQSISIITEIINQLKILNQSIVHADLKSSNIVLDDKTNKPIIIDFGLSKSINDKTDIISTYYISSPESLLTLEDFKTCVSDIKQLDVSKHDYIGLFTIIISIFSKIHFWHIIYKYLIDKVMIKSHYLNNSRGIIIFVYLWYKFNYNKPEEITNKSLYNAIIKIEEIYPNIKNKSFINFKDFYKSYIIDNLKENVNKDQLYDILSKLIKFEPENRPTYDFILTSISCF